MTSRSRDHDLATFLSVVALCALPQKTLSDDTDTERGATLLAPFKASLKNALRAGLEQGTDVAIDVCKLQAPEIAAELSVKDVRVGRSSHRLRNSANSPPDWVSPLMEAYLEAPVARSPVAIELAGDLTGYVEPIIVQPLCLVCHGTSIEPAIAARIDALYPDDEATGFDVGDLRGVYWAEFATR